MLFAFVIGVSSVTELKPGYHRFTANKDSAISINLSDRKYDCFLHWNEGSALLRIEDSNTAEFKLNTETSSILVTGKSFSISFDRNNVTLSAVIFQGGICNESIFFNNNHYIYSKFDLNSGISNLCIFFDNGDTESDLQIASNDTSEIRVFMNTNANKKAKGQIKKFSEKVSFAQLSFLNSSTVKLVKTTTSSTYNCQMTIPPKIVNNKLTNFGTFLKKSEFTCERKPDSDESSVAWVISVCFIIFVTILITAYWILTSFGFAKKPLARRESQTGLTPDHLSP